MAQADLDYRKERLTMRIENNQLKGNQTIESDLELQGQIIGNTTVVAGATLLVRGQVTGNLTVQTGAKAEVWGMVTGSAHCEEGGQLIRHPGSLVGGRPGNS